MKKHEYILFILLMVGLLTVATFAQRAKSALLPLTETKRLTNQCSRPSPEKFTDTWVPTKDEILKMESRLSEIKKLSVKECCIQGAAIENPEKYYMQYVGIVFGGKKLVYISAFSTEKPTEVSIDSSNGILKKQPSDRWKENAIVICDGGNAWGVLYDPIKGKFFDLAVNGIG